MIYSGGGGGGGLNIIQYINRLYCMHVGMTIFMISLEGERARVVDSFKQASTLLYSLLHVVGLIMHD